MSDTEEMPAGRDWQAAVRAAARCGRRIRRNLKAKLTCISPVLSGGRIGAAQPQREIAINLKRGSSPRPNPPAWTPRKESRAAAGRGPAPAPQPPGIVL
jgi:hypothetical protein